MINLFNSKTLECRFQLQGKVCVLITLTLPFAESEFAEFDVRLLFLGSFDPTQKLRPPLTKNYQSSEAQWAP